MTRQIHTRIGAISTETTRSSLDCGGAAAVLYGTADLGCMLRATVEPARLGTRRGTDTLSRGFHQGIVCSRRDLQLTQSLLLFASFHVHTRPLPAQADSFTSGSCRFCKQPSLERNTKTNEQQVPAGTSGAWDEGSFDQGSIFASEQ